MPSPFPPDSRLVAYCRDSGGRDQDMSVPQQEQAIVEFCKQNGYILTRIFRDVARTGTRIAGRDAFLEMISYLSGKVPEAGVVLWAYSRLSRVFDDAQFYLADIRRRGYIVHSITDQIPEGLDGRAMESMKIWMNAKYSQDLSRDIKRGHRYIINMFHAKPGGAAYVGYKEESIEVNQNNKPHVIKRLVPDPELAPLVRMAFELRANGATFKEIHATTHLYSWLGAYSRLLKREIYTGTFVYGDVEIKEFCEPLVDKETWNKAQTINQARADKFGCNHPRVVRSRFMLTGLLYCNRCGARMCAQITAKKGYRKYDYYRCQSLNRSACGAISIPKRDIEERVIDIIFDKLLQPEQIAHLNKEMESSFAVSDNKVAISHLQDELEAAKSEIRKVVAAIKDAGHSPALLTELAELERTENELKTSIVQFENPIDTFVPIDADGLRLALYLADETQTGMILRGFVKRATAEKVDGKITGEITIQFPGSQEIVILL